MKENMKVSLKMTVANSCIEQAMTLLRSASSHLALSGCDMENQALWQEEIKGHFTGLTQLANAMHSCALATVKFECAATKVADGEEPATLKMPDPA
jgi:hypothetical protein